MAEAYDQASTVEPAHKALITQWPLMTPLRHEEKDETLLLQRRLSEAAIDWVTASPQTRGISSPSLLGWLREFYNRALTGNTTGAVDRLWHNSSRLTLVRKTLEGNVQTEENWVRQQWMQATDKFGFPMLQLTNRYWLNSLELEFVRQSIKQRRRTRLFSAGLAAVIFVLVLGLTFTIANLQFVSRRSTVQAWRSLSDNLYSEQPLLALRLALEASIQDKLQRGRIAKLGNNVTYFVRVPGSPLALLLHEHPQVRDEMRTCVDGRVVATLAGQVVPDAVTFISDHLFSVTYQDNTLLPEIREPMSGTVVVTLTGQLDSPGIITLTSDIFLVDYANQPGEIRDIHNGALKWKLRDVVERLEFRNISSPWILVDYETDYSEVRNRYTGSPYEALTLPHNISTAYHHPSGCNAHKPGNLHLFKAYVLRCATLIGVVCSVGYNRFIL